MEKIGNINILKIRNLKDIFTALYNGFGFKSNNHDKPIKRCLTNNAKGLVVSEELIFKDRKEKIEYFYDKEDDKLIQKNYFASTLYKAEFFKYGKLSYIIELKNDYIYIVSICGNSIEIDRRAKITRILNKNCEIERLELEILRKNGKKITIYDKKKIIKEIYDQKDYIENPEGLQTDMIYCLSKFFKKFVLEKATNNDVIYPCEAINVLYQNNILIPYLSKYWNFFIRDKEKKKVLKVVISKKATLCHTLVFVSEPNEKGGRNITIIDSNGSTNNKLECGISEGSLKDFLNFEESKDKIILNKSPFQVDGSCGFCTTVVANECFKRLSNSKSVFDDFEKFNQGKIKANSILVEIAGQLLESFGINTRIARNLHIGLLKGVKKRCNDLDKENKYVKEGNKCFDNVEYLKSLIQYKKFVTGLNIDNIAFSKTKLLKLYEVIQHNCSGFYHLKDQDIFSDKIERLKSKCSEGSSLAI